MQKTRDISNILSKCPRDKMRDRIFSFSERRIFRKCP
nr:MAG TPA: Pentatricopeptide repeat-containing protein [Caudoviricetes sp.]